MTVAVAVGETVPVAVGVAEIVGVSVTADGVAVGVSEHETLGEGVSVSVSVNVAVANSVVVGVKVGGLQTSELPSLLRMSPIRSWYITLRLVSVPQLGQQGTTPLGPVLQVD